MLVILTASFLSNIVEIEWVIIRLAASVNFPTGVTVPVVFHSDGWSTNALTVFLHWWYCYTVVSENNLKFGTRSARCVFDLHCQVGRMHESICSVDDHAVISHEVQPYNEPYQILHYDEMFGKDMVSNIKFKCGCCYWFF